ncbi:flagellar biosynthetic protein FlhB [Parvibaculum indicum]|uniref:flagellar biosynthesis protein FlhB n=1 Tax=Parvibaculum indicum TaxID=562969 RepID=UPI00142362F8|nr:flagellar biosynthesis protein FlhB [Parvibaculum indicum]NIJ41164.1 flagellar biosynthetic protein FlhB [Parvibaculum indicum]
MAEENDSEKTEEPTQKKLDDAAKKGDAPKSQEVNAWFVMLGGALAVMMLGNSTAGALMDHLRIFIAQPEAIPMDAEHLRLVWLGLGKSVMGAIAIPLLILIVAAIAGNVVQHMPVFTGENMKPKLSKISPMKGMERLFGPKSVMNLVKGIVKMAVVGLVTFLIAWPERDRLGLMMTWDVTLLLPAVQTMALRMLAGVIAVMTVVAVLDYMFERMQWMKKQRMSVQEVKDEYKQMEGDPTVKAKLRQIRVERGRKRMMAAVPEATVVITNPTHYAVALKYEQGMGAPIVVAKGMDAIAFKIREIAQSHDIPVLENPPLARALHASVEVDQPIQPEHYKAVAEVIGYVMRLKGKFAKN